MSFRLNLKENYLSHNRWLAVNIRSCGNSLRLDMGAFISGKEKLAKGFSYPLRLADFNFFLERGQINDISIGPIYFSLKQPGYYGGKIWHPQENRILHFNFKYGFKTISIFRDGDENETNHFSAYVHAVPSDKRNIIRQTMLQQVFPLLGKWLDLAKSQSSENARRAGFSLEVNFKDDTLRLFEALQTPLLFDKPVVLTPLCG